MYVCFANTNDILQSVWNSHFSKTCQTCEIITGSLAAELALGGVLKILGSGLISLDVACFCFSDQQVSRFLLKNGDEEAEF